MIMGCVQVTETTSETMTTQNEEFSKATQAHVKNVQQWTGVSTSPVERSLATVAASS
jgi:hypothetical protein